MDNWSKFWSMEDFNFLTTINCPIIKNRKEQRKEIQMKNDIYRMKRRRRKKEKKCAARLSGEFRVYGAVVSLKEWKQINYNYYIDLYVHI